MFYHPKFLIISLQFYHYHTLSSCMSLEYSTASKEHTCLRNPLRIFISLLRIYFTLLSNFRKRLRHHHLQLKFTVYQLSRDIFINTFLTLGDYSATSKVAASQLMTGVKSGTPMLSVCSLHVLSEMTWILLLHPTLTWIYNLIGHSKLLLVFRWVVEYEVVRNVQRIGSSGKLAMQRQYSVSWCRLDGLNGLVLWKKYESSLHKPSHDSINVTANG